MSLPNPLPRNMRLKPSKLKWGFVTLISGGFVALGVLLLLKSDEPLISWLTIGFFALGVVMGVLQLFSDKSYLYLHESGFEHSMLGKKFECSWEEVSEFSTWEMRTGLFASNKSVAFTRDEDTGALAKFNKALVGNAGSLSDNFGMKAEDLADLMNAFRERSFRR